MNRPLLASLLVLAPALFAAPTISNVLIDNVTKSSIRVRWTTDVPTSRDEIQYGLTSAYGKSSIAPAANLTDHVWYVGGLEANKTYHICPQGTDAGSTSICSATQNHYTVTTLSEANVYPESPQPPAVVNTALPAQSGAVLRVSPTNCNDPVTGLQALLNSAQLGDTIEITAGQVCSGVYSFPAKTGSGWVVVRTSTPNSQLPPPGKRISTADKPLLATLRSNAPWFQIYANTGGACTTNNVALPQWGWNVTDVYKCVSNAWQPVTPVAKGPQPPATCQTGEWFYQTGTPAPRNFAWWCIQPNQWEHMVLDTNGNANQTATVTFQNNANHYRLIGLELTTFATPPTEVSLSYQALVYLSGSNSDIVIDRCYLHGQGAPTRLLNGVELQGNNVAIVDSAFDQIDQWTNGHIVPEVPSFAIINDRGGGPYLIENNFIGADGISVFFTDNGGTGTPNPHDVVIRRNYFYRSQRHQIGSAISDGRHYYVRHHLEFKRGERILVDGNVFERSWADTQQGALMALTPRPGPGGPGTYLPIVSDIKITNNLFRDAPAGFIITGHHTSQTSTTGTPAKADFPASLQRLEVSNNVFYNIDGSLVCPSPLAQYPTGNFSIVFNTVLSPEDYVIVHNTIYKVPAAPGKAAYVLSPSGFTTPAASLLVRDNVMPANLFAIIAEGGVAEGTPTLAKNWTRGTNPAYWVDHNVFYAQANKQGNYPSGNYWPATESAVGFLSTTDPFQMALAPGSPYSGQASDGTDPGINLAAFTNAIQNAMDGQWNYPPSSGTPPPPSISIPPLNPRIYPNPWRTDRHMGGITFDQLTGQATVKVFTISGHLVRSEQTTQASYTWDLKNQSGQPVASGMYLYLITNSQGQKARGKLAVIR